VPKKTPDKITIYWDNSFSASERNIEKELDLLNKYLSSIKKDLKVTIFTFNNKVSRSKIFKINNDASEIIDYLKSLKNDGATSLYNINFDNKSEEILLFSDAINTIGNEDFTSPTIPIYAISSSSGSNYSFLKKITSVTNGEFIDLNANTVENAIEIIRIDEEKFLQCQFDNSDIKEVYPNVAKRINKNLEIVGILKNDKATLKVNYGNKDKISQTQTFNISKNFNENISRIWAIKKIESLEINYTKNQSEIYQLGKKFKIVTRNTSFIVLDRVEDYVEHKIIPPADLLDEYNKLMSEQNMKKDTDATNTREENIIRIKNLESWYNKKIVLQNIKKDTFSWSPRNSNNPEDTIESIPQIDVNLYEVEYEADRVSERVFSISGYGEINNDKVRKQKKPSIKVLGWLPDAPYMKKLRKTDENDIESLYFELKDSNKNRPAFYIQIADFLFEKKKKDIAIRILSNIVELDLEHPELLKVIARRLLIEGEYETSIIIYNEIKLLRPEEPQSFRDLALAYTKNKQYQEALDIYQYILETKWTRFDDIKDVVLNELNNLISLHKKKLDISKIDSKYIVSMPLDIRITIDWSSNDNDIDLFVVDPTGEKCFYENKLTKIGGKISKDFTRGYGPEEFSIKTAIAGVYKIYIKYFSEARQRITGPVTVYATFTTNFGTSKEETKHLSVQLLKEKEEKQIGELEFKQ